MGYVGFTPIEGDSNAQASRPAAVAGDGGRLYRPSGRTRGDERRRRQPGRQQQRGRTAQVERGHDTKIKNNAVTGPQDREQRRRGGKDYEQRGRCRQDRRQRDHRAEDRNQCSHERQGAGRLAGCGRLRAGRTTAASNAYARFLNGPVPVAGAVTEATSLSIPTPGNYVIVAKAVADGFGTVTCRVIAGGDTDESAANVNAASPMPISLLVVHNFTAAGTVSFQCGRSGLHSQLPSARSRSPPSAFRV